MSVLYNAYCRTYQGIFRVVTKVLDWSAPQLIKGAGSVKSLAGKIKECGYDNVLVVTDKGLTGLHLPDGLFDALTENGIKYSLYDGTQPNPTFDNIEAARKIYVDNGCKAIVAFGGGSPMDCAKAAGARIAKPKTPISKLQGLLKVRTKIPTLFAVPTTAGTGSETTIAAVVTNPETHEKRAINDPSLRPSYAVLDPELTIGLPKHITSTTGMDALTHAVEAYIGRSNTKDTIEAAEKAVPMIFDNILAAYENGKDITARENMLEASYLAGVAFTRAYVGNVHAIAHNLGGIYGTPHGLANAVILPYVLDYYGSTAYKPLARLADLAGFGKQVNGEKAKAELFIAKIREYNAKMQIPDKFDFIKEEDIPLIAKRALKEANPLYPVPRIMDMADCQTVIRKLMK